MAANNSGKSLTLGKVLLAVSLIIISLVLTFAGGLTVSSPGLGPIIGICLLLIAGIAFIRAVYLLINSLKKAIGACLVTASGLYILGYSQVLLISPDWSAFIGLLPLVIIFFIGIYLLKGQKRKEVKTFPPVAPSSENDVGQQGKDDKANQY